VIEGATWLHPLSPHTIHHRPPSLFELSITAVLPLTLQQHLRAAEVYCYLAYTYHSLT